MKGDKMFELYAEFIGKNEQEIIDSFCLKVREELIGDLTLDEYSRFRFWKHHVKKQLDYFYGQFKEDTKAFDLNYDAFCELLWHNIGDSAPEEIKEMLDSIKNIKIGEAQLSKQAFKYVCAYCGLDRIDADWFIDDNIFGHKAYFDQECINMLNKLMYKEKGEET